MANRLQLESRQERYFGELGRVAASFEPALGDGAASAYTSLMAQAMARHFGNLRRAILRRLRLHAAAAAKRSPNAGSVRSPRGADEATMTRAARPEERSGRRLSSAKRVARGDAMAGDAEPPDDAWRWSSTKVADRWMPCFLRYAIAAGASRAGTGRTEERGAGRSRTVFLGGASF